MLITSSLEAAFKAWTHRPVPPGFHPLAACHADQLMIFRPDTHLQTHTACWLKKTIQTVNPAASNV